MDDSDDLGIAPIAAYDDDDVERRAGAMLARHGMHLMRHISHDPTTHVTRFRVERDAEPGIHIVVELEIDLFTPAMFAQNIWLKVLEDEVVRKFASAPSTSA